MKRRKPIRLSGYDYSSADGYYITIRFYAPLRLMDIVRETAEDVMVELEMSYPVVEFDAWKVQSDHIHLILFLKDYTVGNRTILGEYVRKFKAKITFRINKHHKNAFKWQRLYYDRIIRDERELEKFRRYIMHNQLVHKLRTEKGAINHAPTI